MFLTGGPAWAGGLVLCVCHDGHVSLETTCQPLDCCPDDFAMDAANAGDLLVCADANEEHPCVDVPLLLYSGKPLLVPVKTSAPPPSHSVTADLPCVAGGEIFAASARVVAVDLPILPFEILHSRSTVLLI
ncbi:MAG: hypothetical protein AMXMBFR82_00670 [Candidatus Hydrogenedentota bacterium]